MRRKQPPRRFVRIENGTFAAVIRAYMRSSDYTNLQPSTKRTYAGLLALAEQPETLGALPVELVRPSLVQAFLDGLADTPGRQSCARTALKAVERWAIVRDMIPFPITLGTYCVERDGGHEPWSDGQIALAEAHARPDLARVVTLGIETGQRGSDIVKMRWSDIEESGGMPGINVVQRKTGRRLWIPLTDRLAAILETWERRPPFFMVLKPSGEPYTRELLSWHWNKERDTNPALEPLKAAGLVFHGLRASAVVRARKSGMSVLHISSIFGMSEPMVARYSRLADQRDMAIAAVHILNRAAGTATEQKPQTIPWQKG